MTSSYCFRKIALNLFAAYFIATFLILEARAQGLTGPGSVQVGETHTYTYTDDVVLFDPNWSVTNGSITNIWQSGINYNVSVYFNTGAGTATITFRDGSYTLGYLEVTVDAPAPPTPNTTFNIVYNCGNTVVTRNTNPPYDANYDWWWQTSSTGASTSLGYGSNITRTSTGGLYLRARLKNPPYTWSASSQPVGSGNVTVYTSAPPVPSVANHASRFGSGALTVSVGTVSGALSYVWYLQSSGGTPIAGQTTNSYAISNLTTTTTYFVASKNGCESTGRLPVTATIHPQPVIVPVSSNGAAITMGQPATLGTTLTYATYKWKDSSGAIVGTAPVFTTMTPGYYTVEVTQAGVSGTGTSAPFKVNMGISGQNQNYIVTNTILKDQVTDTNAIAGLSVDEVTQSVQYFDGLGRPLQTVVTMGSPLKMDVVQPFVYDAYGREHRKYLPVVTPTSNGWYKAGILDAAGQYAGAALNFYNNPGDDIADDPAPYSETIFEPSPLNRVVKQGAPGLAWQPDNNHSDQSADRTVKYAYETNQAGEVLLWTCTPPSAAHPFGLVHAGTAAAPAYYAPNQLFKNKTKDEHQNEVIEFTDKQNRTVLKQVQAGAAVYASTYYIYDDYGQLVCVIPPEASARLFAEYLNADDAAKEAFLARWAFRYRYDGRRRLILKQVPGADSVRMVYDNRDRLVMTQDGVQRLTNKWLFTKYDALNRPIITGIYTHSTSATQAEMSALVSTTLFYETFNGNAATHGYTNNVFPTSSIHVLTVTYYDNYDFTALAGGLQYVADNLAVTNVNGNFVQPSVPFNRVAGQVTGTKVNILGTSNYLWAATYYDDKYRVIQTIAQNHKSGTDRVSNLYDFAGKLLQTRRTYVVNGVTTAIRETFTYDHAGRLLRTYHRLNNGAEILLSENRYNELGQLIDKQLHSTDNGITFKQSVDHRYNIRGWLTKINEPDVSTLTPGETLEDYFGMELAYNNALPGVSAAPAFNGNISAMKWSKGVAGAARNQAYSFTYDALNRLKTTGYYRQNLVPGTGWLWQQENSNLETGFQYDLNGNILALQRRGLNQSQMDNLSYTYTGNRLNSVTDTWDATTGFVDGNPGPDDYLYDANGNMTQDRNKSITSITYNHLNLPVQVNKGATDYIVYTYDATGRKLSQQVVGAPPKTTDYIGELLLENDTLRQLTHAEGRALPDGAGWEYQYHLGSVRLTFTSKRETESSVATMETANAASEAGRFLYYTEAVKVNSTLFDHTQAGGTFYSTRLNGSANERTGLARSISVMPGDTIKTEVYAKYLDPNTSNWTAALHNLITSIANGTAPAGTFVDGGGAGSTGGVTPPWLSLLNKGSETGTAPKAYLNYLIFDRNYNLLNGGFVRITTAAREYGQDGVHEKLAAELVITEPGYVYIYLSNDNVALGGPSVEVYFDDFRVEHIKGPVVQEDDYYAFGGTISSYQREGSLKNKFGFAGKELIEDIGLDLIDFGQRHYDRWAPRFTTQDRFAEKYYDFSPYQYAANNPLRYIDINGDSIWVHTNTTINNPDGTTSIQTNRYYYGQDANGANGFIDPATGALYSGNDAFVGQVSGALGTLMSQSAGNALVSDLAGRADNVQIVQGTGDNSAAQDGSFVRWNPGNTGAVGNTRPSFVGLGHELAHVQDSWNGTLNSSAWFSYPTPSGGTSNVPKSEIYSTFIENKIRAEHGLPLRTNYAFDPAGNPVGQNILFNGSRQSRYFDVNGNPNPNYRPINRKKQTPFTH